ncbi:hypothetical protein BaRGS_00025812, partial [Batillaria attramentaria]
GGWEPSGNRGVRPQSSYLHRTYDLQRRERSSPSGSGSGSRSRHSHDDSALYAQSKAASATTMRPSRPRRGDSFKRHLDDRGDAWHKLLYNRHRAMCRPGENKNLRFVNKKVS